MKFIWAITLLIIPANIAFADQFIFFTTDETHLSQDAGGILCIDETYDVEQTILDAWNWQVRRDLDFVDRMYDIANPANTPTCDVVAIRNNPDSERDARELVNRGRELFVVPVQ